jgi:uncharacterized protein YutE (UPF0331/DUF86 family)
MAKADFAQVFEDLDQVESELEPLRVSVDEGEGIFGRAPTAREIAFRHLESAVHHTLHSARALIEGAEWNSPADDLEAIEILVEEEVVPQRIGANLADLAEFAAEESGLDRWAEDGLYDRMSQGVETLSEYLEYVHLFLKEWSE